MDTYAIERLNNDETVAWANHPTTKHLRKQAIWAKAVALETLLNAALRSTDPDVVRLATEVRAATELEALLTEPKDNDDEPTDD